jgi:hypothetical protein
VIRFAHVETQDGKRVSAAMAKKRKKKQQQLRNPARSSASDAPRESAGPHARERETLPEPEPAHGLESVRLDPVDGEAWLILGAAYQMVGDAKEARRAFASCLKEGKRGPRGECAAMSH